MTIHFVCCSLRFIEFSGLRDVQVVISIILKEGGGFMLYFCKFGQTSMFNVLSSFENWIDNNHRELNMYCSALWYQPVNLLLGSVRSSLMLRSRTVTVHGGWQGGGRVRQVKGQGRLTAAPSADCAQLLLRLGFSVSICVAALWAAAGSTTLLLSQGTVLLYIMQSTTYCRLY